MSASCSAARCSAEALTELEIPYLLHNVGKGSPRREAYVARSGKMKVPYLADPNTGRELFESAGEAMMTLSAGQGAHAPEGFEGARIGFGPQLGRHRPAPAKDEMGSSPGTTE